MKQQKESDSSSSSKKTVLLPKPSCKKCHGTGRLGYVEGNMLLPLRCKCVKEVIYARPSSRQTDEGRHEKRPKGKVQDVPVSEAHGAEGKRVPDLERGGEVPAEVPKETGSEPDSGTSENTDVASGETGAEK